MRARRLRNGNLLIPMRAEWPEGVVGDGVVEIAPGHPDFETWLRDARLPEPPERLGLDRADSPMRIDSRGAARIRVLSWNVNGRVRGTLQQQLECVLAEAPDVLALQEVTLNSYEDWWQGLLAAGYSVASNVELSRLPYPDVDPPVRRKYLNVTATRGRIATLPGLSFSDPGQARLAFPEKYLVTRISLGALAVDVHNAHLPPGSSRGELKMQAFQAIRRRIDEPTSVPRVLCGDFNTPQAEDDESVTTWASSHPALRDEWDAAERGVLAHPKLRDLYREQHPPSEPYPASHYTRGIRRRYDHIYASDELQAVGCRYITDWLEERLSDHAPVEADLILAPRVV